MFKTIVHLFAEETYHNDPKILRQTVVDIGQIVQSQIRLLDLTGSTLFAVLFASFQGITSW